VLSVDRAGGAVFALFSVLVLWESNKIPFGTLADPGPGALPTLLAAVLLLCSCVMLLGSTADERISAIDWSDWRHGAAILGTLAFMSLAMENLGYRITIFAALLVLVRFVESKGWIATLVFAGAFSLGTHYLFHTLLQVQLPTGPFGI
jgi:hypothetical protein